MLSLFATGVDLDACGKQDVPIKLKAWHLLCFGMHQLPWKWL